MGILRSIKIFLTRNLKVRLIAGFIIAVFVTGLVATLAGIRIMNRYTIGEVQRKVQEDINTAQLIYNQRLYGLAVQLKFIALKPSVKRAILKKDFESLKELSRFIRKPISAGSDYEEGEEGMDMLSIIDKNGYVMYRVANTEEKGDSMLWDPIVRECLQQKMPKAGTELMPIDTIEKENPRVSSRVKIKILKTPRSIEIKQKYLKEGLVLRASYPILDEKEHLVGLLVGGILINNDYFIVDKIKQTVYHNEKYKGRDMGFATIFQGGVRVSTNVVKKDGSRAIGTIVSKEVYNRVIKQGKNWFGRAFVVNDWYLSSYIPIYDIEKNIIGMLYVGILEARYKDMTRETILIFLGITIFGMIIALTISSYSSNIIVREIQKLKTATEAISSGDLEYKLPSTSPPGFDILDDAFNNMITALKDRDKRLQKAYQEITKCERLAALGQMAAGVAHEINNPLGGILLYANLAIEDLSENHPSMENLKKIVHQTNRCKRIVENLLDFARAPSGEMVPLDINEVIVQSLNLVKEHSAFINIEVETQFEKMIPRIKGDRSGLEQVFLNLFINGANAMNGKGTLTVKTRLTSANTIKIYISDTGMGIDQSYLPHIFEPFFTTKEPGKGTGLGLFISYGIIKKHNGFIDVDSKLGEGTTFIITLPTLVGSEDTSMEQQEAKTIG